MEDNSVSCKLKISKDLAGKTPVFLVDFPNGAVNFNNSDKLNFKCYRQCTNEDVGDYRTKRVLCATNDRLKFKSTTYDDKYCGSRFRYFVGVRKKKSTKMRVYESVSFHLKPLRNSCDTSLTSETKNLREKLDDLTSSFGSKGKKRSMASRLKYSTDNSQLDSTLDDLALDDSLNNYSTPVNKTSTTNIEYIPPQNRDAQFVNEVYNIKDIIPIEVDEYLAERAEELLQDIPTHLTRWKTDSTFCEYVLKHMDVDLSNTKMKYLILYNYMVKFSCLLSSDIRKKDPAPEIPEPVKSYLLETFTAASVMENGRTVRSFPQKVKDKLLAYIIVIALFIDDFCVNIALLQNGMKYGIPKVSNVAQAVGCYVNRRKINNVSVQFAELKLPLNSLTKYYKKS